MESGRPRLPPERKKKGYCFRKGKKMGGGPPKKKMKFNPPLSDHKRGEKKAKQALKRGIGTKERKKGETLT